MARAWEFRRLMVGGTVVALPALNSGGDPNSSIARISDAAGRSGVSATDIPVAPASIGIIPVATSIRSQTSTPGISSGVPVPLRLVMSASPA